MNVLFVFFLSILSLSQPYGKFDGISFGASVGIGISSLKEKSASENLKQLGNNGKLYAGIGKSFLDVLFVGVEIFGRYKFFVQPSDSEKITFNEESQFGGYLKVGLRPTENLLVYGTYGDQTTPAKIKYRPETLFEPSDGAWSTLLGAGVEYALGLGAAIRTEGTYEPKISFKAKDMPGLEYDINCFAINFGISVYL